MAVKMTPAIMADYEAKAIEEYRRSLGKVFLVTELSGYTDEDFPDADEGGYFDVSLDAPARVRLIETDEDALKHWCCEWLDPYWDVELVEPHPELPKTISSLWTGGPSYNAETGERQSELSPVDEASEVSSTK